MQLTPSNGQQCCIHAHETERNVERQSNTQCCASCPILGLTMSPGKRNIHHSTRQLDIVDGLICTSASPSLLFVAARSPAPILCRCHS